MIVTSEPKCYVLKDTFDVYSGYNCDHKEYIVEYRPSANKDNDVICYPMDARGIAWSFPKFFEELNGVRAHINSSRKFVKEATLRADLYDKFIAKELKPEDLVSSNNVVSVYLDYMRRVFVQFVDKGSWHENVTLAKAEENLTACYIEYDRLMAQGYATSDLSSYRKDAEGEAYWLTIYEYMLEHKLEIIKEILS